MSQWGKGHLIKDRYRLLDKLGQGGMGSVWRAEHVELKSLVAVKLLDPAIAKNEEMVARFLREARASASLKSRHVVQVFDHGIQEGQAFMVMELLHGQTLGERIERDGRLPPEQAVRFMCQVMRAIGGAHDQGIVHRDLKPDNIFITSDDEGEYAKVLDFGVAKVKENEFDQAEGVKTQTGMMLGTPYYMSPEQAKAKRVDHRTDIWALGVITFECLIGKRPFTGDSFGDLVIKLCSGPIPIPSALGQVPLGFDEWFVHSTQREADRRFGSAREMADELMQLAHNPIVGRRGDAPVDETAAAIERRDGPRPARLGGQARPVGRQLADTTGRGAAFDMDRPQVPLNRTSRLGLMFLGIVGAGIVGAGLALFLPQKGSPGAVPEPAAALAAEAAAAPAAEATPAAPAPAPAALEVAEPEPVPVAATQTSASSQPATTKAPATQPTASKTATAKAPAQTSKPAAHSKTSTTKGTAAPEKAVPVVDKQTLPPQSWEF